MHPCREYWGQDIAYGSLVTGERVRRADRTSAAPETYIVDVDAGAARHAELAGLVRRIAGFDSREEGLKLSAAHLKEFLLAAKKAGIGGAVGSVHEVAGPDESDVRILGIATLHCSPSPFAAALAERAGIPSRAAREASSAQLCGEFMERLTELGAREDVEQIDWVMVRVGDDNGELRAHLGATRVSRLELQPFAPGGGAAAEGPTAATSSAGPAPAA